MRLATWNVNSIRARLERATAWLKLRDPDVVCLQELKTDEASFPRDAFTALGYHAHAVCQKTYNGVAILSKRPIVDATVGMLDDVDDPQARLCAGTIDGVRVLCAYMPNGQEVGSDKWRYKLAWMERLRRYLERHCDPEQPLALCGDFNVAPDERDVYNPTAWEKEPLYHPEARAGLRAIADWGLVDSLRLHRQDAGIYSWWDYRMLAFPKNRGLRIDHIYLTKSLVPRCTGVTVDRDERKGQQPSDHAPVIAELS